MTDRVQRRGEVIPQDIRSKISHRYRAITKAINLEFWDSISDTLHSFYVGSYGRNTAIDTSDIDILVELPNECFDRFNNIRGNGQSKLLQVVKNTILNTYPKSDVRADGQVVKISFADAIYFEIVPAFKNYYEIYQYPDSNKGGRWRSTNPKAEQCAMYQKNKDSNGLLYDTCKHIRYIRDNKFSSYHLSGIVIDSFVYEAIGTWGWSNSEENSSLLPPIGTYEQVLLDYYNYHGIGYGKSIIAPGSNDIVVTDSSYECLGKVLIDMI
ncbi:nucleotidyltransferase domain-containing protein [Succinatimonas hippei]|uniref:SMODS domain-containing nucleotidyltransferase n=1 Tax=Succinatimonas hippei TaxID=626938 RepID=UPI00201244D1|nr:nucleotidyltransferase domain-containing protein [Succinatimonas hippei]MCL1604280.1 nucleotidyltransferase domain-containing protein [Succinatimonas hippei]